jgi:predicted AAA+ superfamily ATPase
MELKRKFYDYLLSWKEEKARQCLLVNGARQIGKTFIIEKFGRENYEGFIEINFALDPECRAIFEGALDARSIRERLTAIKGDARIIPGKTLLFLDEIQDCPNARTAFKPLALDGTFDVIASGSLLGIKYKKGKLRKLPRSVPVGFERQVTMYSLSFEEYLEARGFGPESLALVRNCFTRREIVPDAVNERFHRLLREYAVVGGMPAVVAAFVERGHYGEVQTLQEALVADYIADIHKYADKTDIPKVENCFRAIPRILAKENRKFKYAEVEDHGTARKYLSSVEWLKDAKLATLAECVNVALPGLSGMLERNGFPIRYFRNDDCEVEFVVETEDGVVPVEVKSSTGRTRSLDKIVADDAIPYGIKLTGGNVGVAGKRMTLPHYMAMFLQPANSCIKTNEE